MVDWAHQSTDSLNTKRLDFYNNPSLPLDKHYIRWSRVEYWITLACGCWKVTLELLMSDEYLNKWVGEAGNLWLLLGWLCRTAEKQMWTVSFSAFIWDSCPQTKLHTRDGFWVPRGSFHPSTREMYLSAEAKGGLVSVFRAARKRR